MRKPTGKIFMVVFCVEHITVMLDGTKVYSYDSVCVILVRDKTVLNAVFSFARDL